MNLRRRFLVWLAVLGAVWLAANWPHNLGVGWYLARAGCPWMFAWWEGDRLVWFDAGAFAADVGLGLALAVPTAWLCAWSRGSPTGPPSRT